VSHPYDKAWPMTLRDWGVVVSNSNHRSGLQCINAPVHSSKSGKCGTQHLLPVQNETSSDFRGWLYSSSQERLTQCLS
jgi:hypothetical protein